MNEMANETQPGMSEPTNEAAGKAVMITSKGDGTFSVQSVSTDGQPEGEPTDAKTIDEAMQSAQSTLTGTAETEGSPAEEATETPAEEGTEPMSAEAEAAAQYAKKRGTRPKQAPNWEDYGVDTQEAK